MNDKDEIVAKMKEYQVFVEDVLKPQLSQAQGSRDETQNEINEYNQLMGRLQELQDGSAPKTMEVDLVHQKVFCNAQIDNADSDQESAVFIHVGMGFHVEFTFSEGVQFVDRRINYLEQVLQYKETKLQKVEDHISSSEFILSELSKELRGPSLL
mmetsp:Transcript_38993/g.80970  ORF Transcript_38993/g.80970 Transcript_38993/m.80970 type:complete len:155 (-) Transcript_38993:1124-1588(-)